MKEVEHECILNVHFSDTILSYYAGTHQFYLKLGLSSQSTELDERLPQHNISKKWFDYTSIALISDKFDLIQYY